MISVCVFRLDRQRLLESESESEQEEEEEEEEGEEVEEIHHHRSIREHLEDRQYVTIDSEDEEDEQYDTIHVIYMCTLLLYYTIMLTYIYVGRMKEKKMKRYIYSYGVIYCILKAIDKRRELMRERALQRQSQQDEV